MDFNETASRRSDVTGAMAEAEVRVEESATANPPCLVPASDFSFVAGEIVCEHHVCTMAPLSDLFDFLRLGTGK
jgi:hypothetical protein